MARFFGEVGYGDSIEKPSNSGVWVDTITEAKYYGDVIRNTRKLEAGESLTTILRLEIQSVLSLMTMLSNTSSKSNTYDGRGFCGLSQMWKSGAPVSS